MPIKYSNEKSSEANFSPPGLLFTSQKYNRVYSYDPCSDLSSWEDKAKPCTMILENDWKLAISKKKYPRQIYFTNGIISQWKFPEKCNYTTVTQVLGTCWLNAVVNVFKNTALFSYFIPRSPNTNYDEAIARLQTWTKRSILVCPWYGQLGNDVKVLYQFFYEIIRKQPENLGLGFAGGFSEALILALICACNVDVTFFENVVPNSLDQINNLFAHKRENLRLQQEKQYYKILDKNGKTLTYSFCVMNKKSLKLPDMSKPELVQKYLKNKNMSEENIPIAMKLYTSHLEAFKLLLNYYNLPYQPNRLFIADLHLHNMTERTMTALTPVLVKHSNYGVLAIKLKNKQDIDFDTEMRNQKRGRQLLDALSFFLGFDILRHLNIGSVIVGSTLLVLIQYMKAIYFNPSFERYHAISFVKCDGRIMFCNSWGQNCSDYEKLDCLIDHVSSVTVFSETK